MKKKKRIINEELFKKISNEYISRCQYLADQQRASLNYEIDKRIEYHPASGRNKGDYGKPKKGKRNKSSHQQMLSPLKYNINSDNFNINDYDDIAKIDNINELYISNNEISIDDNDDKNKRLCSPIRPRWDPNFHVINNHKFIKPKPSVEPGRIRPASSSGYRKNTLTFSKDDRPNSSNINRHPILSKSTPVLNVNNNQGDG